MGTLVVIVCLLAACIVGVRPVAWLGYGRVKAGFGRAGFYIEADDLSVQPSGGALPSSRDKRAPAAGLTHQPRRRRLSRIERDGRADRPSLSRSMRRMSKSELFTHFAERFGIRRAEAGEFFDELQQLTEQELLRCGEFVLPGVEKLVVQQRERRMGRNREA